MYFFGAAAGLTFISVASDLGKHALGSLAFLAVVVLAVGNSSGRILAGVLSDRIGRQWTLLAEFVCQAVVVAVLYKLSGERRDLAGRPRRRLPARLQLRGQPGRLPGRLQGLLRPPQLRAQLRLPLRRLRHGRAHHAVAQRLHPGRHGPRPTSPTPSSSASWPRRRAGRREPARRPAPPAAGPAVASQRRSAVDGHRHDLEGHVHRRHRRGRGARRRARRSRA